MFKCPVYELNSSHKEGGRNHISDDTWNECKYKIEQTSVSEYESASQSPDKASNNNDISSDELSDKQSHKKSNQESTIEYMKVIEMKNEDVNKKKKQKVESHVNSSSLYFINDLHYFTHIFDHLFSNQKKKKPFEKTYKKKWEKLPEIKVNKRYTEIGCLGVWSVSSSKSKKGSIYLRDGNASTFWQTKGTTPHKITVQFSKLLKITQIFLLFNYSVDESYTPYNIAIHVGDDEHNLTNFCKATCDLSVVSLKEPFWFVIDARKVNPCSYIYNFHFKFTKKNRKHINYVCCRCLQIEILSSQQQGQNTRIRQILLYGPLH